MSERKNIEALAEIREIQYQRNRWQTNKTIPIRQIDTLLEIIDSQALEIERLKQALNASVMYENPLDIVAGGPGAPGLDGESP